MTTIAASRTRQIASSFDNTPAHQTRTTALYQTKKNSLQPRLSAVWSPTSKTVIVGGAGIFVGPGQTEDQIQPVGGTHQHDGLVGRPASPAFPSTPPRFARTSRTTRTTVRISRAPMRTNTRCREGLQRNAVAAGTAGQHGRVDCLRRQPGTQPVPAQHREPHDRRAQTNGASAATRRFASSTSSTARTDACWNGTVSPLTSANLSVGFDDCQHPASVRGSRLQDQRRPRHLQLDAGLADTPFGQRPRAERQCTLGWGNTGGSNEATTASNNARGLGDFGSKTAATTSTCATRSTSARFTRFPAAGLLKGGWASAPSSTRATFPSTSPSTRPTWSTMDTSGNVFLNPAADRTAVVNVPGGGASRATRRPTSCLASTMHHHRRSAVHQSGCLHPPKPGTFGNLSRNALHSPSLPADRHRGLERRCRLVAAPTESSVWKCSTSSTRRTSPTLVRRSRTHCPATA